jgi:threonylcarbamoyladenosine tRNA methylthiotransferase MtaB
VAAIVDSFDRRAGIKRFIELPASEDKLNPIIYSRPHERTRAFVKIQDGCQSFCSYCIVPYARGPVRSKEPRHVLAEITSLVSLGYKEIVLSGIHTGFYGIDLPGWDLTRLVTLILDQVEGNYRIRLSSIEPLEVNNRLIELMAASSRICRHLHIPLQSGSDRILYSMRRRYTGSYYQELILKIAGQIPAMAFTADVMVGYPTETQVDFEASYDIIKKLPLYDLHVFKYSRRPEQQPPTCSPR